MLSRASCNSSRVLAPAIRKRWEFISRTLLCSTKMSQFTHLHCSHRKKSHGLATYTTPACYPAHFPTFPSIRLAILFTRMLAAICDKCLEAGWYMPVGNTLRRVREALGTITPTIPFFPLTQYSHYITASFDLWLNSTSVKPFHIWITARINTYSSRARSLDCFCQLHINFALYSKMNFCVTNTHTAHIP